MQKRKRNSQKSKLQNPGDLSEDSSRSMSPSARSHKKKVRWEGRTGPSTQDSDTSDSPEDSESQIIEKIPLAVLCSHGNVGCAYFDPAKRVLCVLEDTQETIRFDLIRMLLEQVNPDVVLTSSKADDSFIDAVNEHVESANTIFQIRPFKEFIPSKGRDRLLSLKHFSGFANDELADTLSSDSNSTSSRPNNAYEFMRSRRDAAGDPSAARWNASIRISNFASVETSPLCVASIGALLDHIVRERALAEFDDDGIGGLDITNIEIISLQVSQDHAMQINADALLSLQVFENESHASVHSDKTKEGLSLFGILNGTKTTSGRSLLRTWLLRPSLSIPTIKARHDAVECFLRPENIATAARLHNHLKGIKNMPRIMNLLRDGKGRVSEWQGLVKFTFHATMLRDSLSELHQASQVEVLSKLIGVLDISMFKEIGVKVNDVIDWEESSSNDRVCVRSLIDEDLDNRKHVYHGIDSSSVAEQISLTVPISFATSLNVVYFPQLGYLICVPMLDEWKNDQGIQGLDGWTFQVRSAHVYFKSQEMHDMDIHVGDLHSTIVDRELEIVQELLEDVLTSDDAIGAACDVCAELDCLLSFAEASQLYEYQRPQMVDQNIIEIIQGRHPLHERVVDIFVPNDARIIGGAGIGSSAVHPNGDDEWNSVLLCTGANACGKSVYLKQIAIIQIMAQIGCFVPAMGARLGIVDKIFTRVSTRESVSKVQSAFMIDLAQVSLALRNCTARSLVLLDEFGKGTLSTGSSTFSTSSFDCYCYGAGIFCGVLRHLLKRGTNCPKTLVATHFHDVFNEELLDPENIPVSFRHMQVMFTTSSGAIVESDSHDTGATSGSPSISDTTYDELKPTKIGPTEKITYLYRVAEGLSLDSHAAKCAEIFGIPSRIVERAQHISCLLSSHQIGQLLDEGMTESERLDLEDAESVCRRFLSWDLKADEDDIKEGQVKIKLRDVLGRDPVVDCPQ
ncbi:hypothetical protein M413DRAFT_436269 [Hebeloma cylindrosporum]|uniref:DNA mismatch repair proteins mutS family domain-containing protein n=1 Tax=Hebeloma cylindrosporum TaxID=76867 RepID=A0A0C3C3C4_HEBCY|nr:hypothetical protein M413DRAFT_436269 [Hebeloma cylindrosporum h7]